MLIIQSQRKQFYIGQENSGKKSTHRQSAARYCVKYNQHAEDDNTRRSWACSPGKFGKTDARGLNLGAFQ